MIPEHGPPMQIRISPKYTPPSIIEMPIPRNIPPMIPPVTPEATPSQMISPRLIMPAT